jgi:hypothetical protein
MNTKIDVRSIIKSMQGINSQQIAPLKERLDALEKSSKFKLFCQQADFFLSQIKHNPTNVVKTPGFSETDLESVIGYLKSSRIFIIDDRLMGDGSPCEEIPSLPFKLCFFEPTRPLGFTPPTDELLVAVLIKEYEPLKYQCWPMMYDYRRDLVYLEQWDSEAQETKRDLFVLVNQFLSSFQRGSVGYEKVGWKIKLGFGSKREQCKINEIVRIVPKSEHQTAKPMFSREIDWSHRWEVMGHWRKINGIGKDRSGQYCVSGMTWVVPHEKGPEGKVLVKKTRVIQAASNRGAS